MTAIIDFLGMRVDLRGWLAWMEHASETILPALIGALIIIVITFFASRMAFGRLRDTLERGGIQVNVSILLARTLWAAVWTMGFLLVLKIVGVGFTPLAAFVGVTGLAASLSLQTVLQNLVAGVYLLAERPFAIDDFIAVVGPNGTNHEGTVEDVQMRTTHLRSRDDELILIPNSAIFSGVVTNRTAVGGFVQHATVTFPRGNDPATMHAEILQLLRQVPLVLALPEPRLRVTKVEGELWTGALSFWAGTQDTVSHAAWVIAQAYPEATVDLAVTTG